MGTLLLASLAAVALAAIPGRAPAAPLGVSEVGLTPEQLLGSRLFFDTTLSNPGGQSCGSCHTASAAFTDPDKSSPTSKGVNPALFGSRNAPTAMYMAFSPTFHYDQAEGLWIGGQFLDGRAATLEDQAKAPFLNPVEMANPNKESVIEKLRASANADLFKYVYGPDSLSNVEAAYNQLAQAIASFERTSVLSPFSSKYDAYLDGKTSLTAPEARGLALFEDPMKGNCAACHPSQPGADGSKPLFTDFTYDNLGVPKNPHNRFYVMSAEFNPDGKDFVDIGLGKTTGDSGDDGKLKVPTLRNLTLTGAYMHNGYFETLEGVVDFYNTRDVKPVCADPMTSEEDALEQGCWPLAEVADNVNADELGNLGLTSGEVKDIVAFLGTLTDGWLLAEVSEPGILGLLGVGLAGLGATRTRRRGARQQLLC